MIKQKASRTQGIITIIIIQLRMHARPNPTPPSLPSPHAVAALLPLLLLALLPSFVVPMKMTVISAGSSQAALEVGQEEGRQGRGGREGGGGCMSKLSNQSQVKTHMRMSAGNFLIFSPSTVLLHPSHRSSSLPPSLLPSLPPGRF